MKNLEQMLEDLNDSDVICDIGDLKGSVDCLGTVETVADLTEVRISHKIGGTSIASAIAIADAGLVPQGAPQRPEGE